MAVRTPTKVQTGFIVITQENLNGEGGAAAYKSKLLTAVQPATTSSRCATVSATAARAAFSGGRGSALSLSAGAAPWCRRR